MKAELVPENGDPPIPITRDVTVVGRRGYCDVVIDDPSLSKRHCVLVKTDGLLVIRDLATTNGTKVKGQRVRWAALLPDDRIVLGNYKLRVYLGPADAPGPSELAKWGASGKRARPPSAAASPRAAAPGVAGQVSQEETGSAPPASGKAPAGGFVVLDDEDDSDEGEKALWKRLIKTDDDDVMIELE